MCYGHGTDSNGRPRGTVSVECYNNTLTDSYSGYGQSFIGSRSGVTYAFNNTLTMTGSGAGMNAYINLATFRRYGSWTTYGFGDGQGSWDTNDGTTYASGTATGGNGTTTLTVSGTPWTVNQWQNSGDPYSVVDTTLGCGSEILSNTTNTLTVIAVASTSNCSAFNVTSGDSYLILRASVLIDQPSRAVGTYISGSTPTPTGSVAQSLYPMYEWGDTYSGGSITTHTISNLNDLGLIANRDWYAQSSGIQTTSSSPFNGTSGTGWGTLANRPSTCTTGVGYAVTTSVPNQLYTCTSANTWTLSYTAYTYPHPLAALSGGAGGVTSSGSTTYSGGVVVN